jgi:hypothetical protein
MRRSHGLSLALLFAVLGMGADRPAHGHCDTMDGRVVTAARSALERGDVTPVLRWVAPRDEGEVRTAFERASAARKGSPAARDVADQWFFETLVRIHRAGEGEPYTGIQPSGTFPGPGIREADEALDTSRVDGLAEALAAMVAEGARARFQRVIEARKRADSSVEAGRQFVAAYVEFIHYVERVHELGAEEAHAHHDEAPGAGGGDK